MSKKNPPSKKPGQGSADKGTTLPLNERIKTQFEFIIDPDILLFYTERPTKEMMDFCIALHTARRMNRIVNAMSSV